MALILNLETATTMCSVALAENGKVIAQKEKNEGYSHAENLTSFIQEVIHQAGRSLSDLDAVAVSKGPGSYTGLRIGVSSAKGLCYGLEKPLIGINTLAHFAGSVTDKTYTYKCPMLDARRMEVYCAVYDSNNNCIRQTSADIITETSFADLLERHKVVFFGDGAAKCKQLLQHQANAIFIEDLFPSAVDMAALAEQRYQNKQFEDVAYFEPFYLKEFMSTTPKQKKS
jgi:tRNA threonylcarbamoyladenosine biosynthesis protein TsaB